MNANSGKQTMLSPSEGFELTSCAFRCTGLAQDLAIELDDLIGADDQSIGKVRAHALRLPSCQELHEIHSADVGVVNVFVASGSDAAYGYESRSFEQRSSMP
jgi:hypothetical protein